MNEAGISERSEPAPASGQRKIWPWWVFLIVIGGCCCGGSIVLAILLPVFASSRQAAIQTQCVTNMKNTASAVILYSEDNDDRFPPSSEWHDAVEQYGKNLTGCPKAMTGSLGYAYSDVLDRKPATKFENFQTEVLLFETPEFGFNVSGNPRDEVKPSRHARNNTAFLDGHVSSRNRPR